MTTQAEIIRVNEAGGEGWKALALAIREMTENGARMDLLPRTITEARHGLWVSTDPHGERLAEWKSVGDTYAGDWTLSADDEGVVHLNNGDMHPVCRLPWVED